MNQIFAEKDWGREIQTPYILAMLGNSCYLSRSLDRPRQITLMWSEDVRTLNFGFRGSLHCRKYVYTVYTYHISPNKPPDAMWVLHGFAMAWNAWKVVKGLIGIQDGNALPKDHMIECVCELLQAIGSTVDSDS